MPHGHKTPGIIVAEVRLHKADGDCSVLIVEGADDARFWTSRKHGKCELVDGEGKPNVVQGISELDAADVSGVLGVIDEDYDYLMGEELESENLVRISPHDLECLLCCSAAFDSLLAEFGDPEKISRFVEKEGVDIRSALLDRALIFGHVRWAALRSGIAIPERAISVSRFVDSNTWTVDGDQLIGVVASDNEYELRKSIERLPNVFPWRTVRGHDVLAILRIGFRNVLGNLKSSVGVRDIARVLRSGIDAAELQATELWMDIRKWETTHPPYEVLPSDPALQVS
jgi:hypothetical protein